MKKFIFIAIIFVCSSLVSVAETTSDLNLNENDKYKITLQEAMDMALLGNIELQEQKRNLGIAKNEVKIANALKNPSFVSNFLLGKVTKGNASQFGVTLPVEIAKRGVRKKSAEAQSLYVQNKFSDYEFKLKLRIRTSYFNLLLAKSDLKIMEDKRELLEDLADISKKKPKNNDDYTIDVLQADMRLKKQMIQINKSKANVKTAQYNFNRVLNLENNLTLYDSKEDTLFDKSLNIESNIPGYEELEQIAFKNRYDIKMSEAKILKTRRDIDVAVRKRVPDLYIGGGTAYQTAAQTGNSAVNGAYVSAGFEIPSLYLYTPEIKNAKLEYEKAQLEYNLIINITKNIIHTDYDKLIIAKVNLEHYKSIVNESNEILKLSKQKYKKGQMPLTSLIVIEHSHQELLNEYLSAIGVYYNSYIDLLKEVGTDNLSSVSDL